MKDPIQAWADAVSLLLAEMSEQDFGYPISVNELLPPVAYEGTLPSTLAPLYAVIGGANLMDVHVGYCIDPPEVVAGSPGRGPTVIRGHSTIPIRVFGADGGGNLFAIGTEVDAVYYLLHEAALEEVYVETDREIAKLVGASLLGFLDRLYVDIEAFVHMRERHVYMTR